MALRHKQFWKKRYLLPEGMTTQHPFYICWRNMKARCENPKDSGYKNYGGRGIRVCDGWRNFEGFYSDMFSSYEDGLTLERIDNNLDYSKKNCKWLPRSLQSRNRRVVSLHYGKTLNEWAKELGIKCSTMRQRYYVYGWTIDECITGKRGY